MIAVKSKYFYTILLACLTLFVSGCPAGKSSSGNKNNRPDTEKIIRENEILKKENEKTKSELQEAQKQAKTRGIIIIASVCTVSLIFALFVALLYRNKRRKAHEHTDCSTNNSRCPRCGWEHDPTESVCKNCGTHF